MDVYEGHITVSSESLDEQERFVNFCKTLEIKPVLIELPYGQFSKQLMSSSVHYGDREKVLQELFSTGEKFSKKGFKLKRRKLEASLINSEIPLTDEEAKRFPKNYFEFHIKVASPDKKLEDLCRTFEAHLSRSISSRNSGKDQKFVTLREYNVGKYTALFKYEFLLNELKRQGYGTTTRIKEYTVFDDNIKLDGTWGLSCLNCSSICPFTD